MRSLRAIGVYLLLALGGLAVTSPALRADDDDRNWRRGHFNRWYGGYSNPYYWNSRSYNYNPYSGYNPYRNWNRTGNYNRGYYNTYPYYNWSRTYPYSLYW